MPTLLRPHVALATCARLPDLWTDDQVLAGELRGRGRVEVSTPVWDDATTDWSAYDVVIIRNTWDYWHRHAAYVAWARHVADVSVLLNPAPVVEWNTHKGYLRDLEAAGVPIVPTAWFDAGGRGDVAAVMAERRWADVVVKPAVSAAAEDTVRTSTVGIEEAQRVVDRVLPTRDVMVQPYVEAVETTGERSLLYVDGALTHAVRRPPYLTSGIGAESVPAEPADDEVAVAEQVLGAVPGGAAQLLYARVDLIRDTPHPGDAVGRPMLMEVELVEPSMFFALSEAATDRMAGSIEARAIEGRAGSAGRSTRSGS